MIRINIHDAKTHLSRLLGQVEAGETVLLCRRHVPVAEIRGVVKPDETPRPIGLAAGEFQVPDSFFEALPDEVLAGFEGHEA